MPYEIRHKKYAWGTLWIKADMPNSRASVSASTDGPEAFSSTPYQTASFAHEWKRAFREINEWLKNQGGN